MSTLSPISSNYIRHILDIHFHPTEGTPYWIERQKQLKFKNYKEVKDWESFKEIIGFQSAQDMKKFEQDTRFLSLENFIPESTLSDKNRTIWASQTGGTTGAPKHGCWDSVYWKHVLDFTDEFLDLHHIPRNANWLFMGPMGPHTTGRLMVSIAENRGGQCFTIDLDPRFVKIAVKEKLDKAHERYIEHIWQQTKDILKYQNISVLFSTSRLLEMAPEYIDTSLITRKIKGIVHAGTSLEEESLKLFTEHVYKGIPIVGLYGTSTTGISYQSLNISETPYRIVYIPSTPYITLEIVNDNGMVVPYEEEGWVATYRLTEDYLIPGFWERDKAKRVKSVGKLVDKYPWDWVADIYSPFTQTDKNLDGVY